MNVLENKYLLAEIEEIKKAQKRIKYCKSYIFGLRRDIPYIDHRIKQLEALKSRLAIQPLAKNGKQYIKNLRILAAVKKSSLYALQNLTRTKETAEENKRLVSEAMSMPWVEAEEGQEQLAQEYAAYEAVQRSADNNISRFKKLILLIKQVKQLIKQKSSTEKQINHKC